MPEKNIAIFTSDRYSKGAVNKFVGGIVMGIVIASAVVISLAIIGLTIYVTNKAYSRKWEK